MEQAATVIPDTTARFSVTSLDFGDVEVGDMAASVVTLHNDGTAVADFRLQDGLSEEFRSDGSRCSSVPPNGSCELNVYFLPVRPFGLRTTVISPRRAEVLSNRLTITGTSSTNCGGVSGIPCP